MKLILTGGELSQAVKALLIQATYKQSNLKVLGAILKCQEVCQVLNTQVYIFNCQQPKYPRQDSYINSSFQINVCWKIMFLPLKLGNSTWLACISTMYLFSRTPTTLFILALFSKQSSTGDLCKTIRLHHRSSQGEDSICSVISNLGQRPRLRKDKGHCLHLCQSERAPLKFIELYLTQIHMKTFCVC